MLLGASSTLNTAAALQYKQLEHRDTNSQNHESVQIANTILSHVSYVSSARSRLLCAQIVPRLAPEVATCVQCQRQNRLELLCLVFVCLEIDKTADRTVTLSQRRCMVSTSAESDERDGVALTLHLAAIACVPSHFRNRASSPMISSIAAVVAEVAAAAADATVVAPLAL